ncbi:MAG: 4Fe-4S dicluster domain-containing protein [Chloroflexota bacterium]|nr:4Fe-4S dicluster domain-containing protein [Chloroflexota bacterium]
MERPVLPEWSGDKLRYVGPLQTCWKLGYTFSHRRQPAEDYYSAAISARVPLQDGEASPARFEFGSERKAAEAVKAKAAELGADDAGVTPVDPHYVYEGEEVEHRYAVVMAFEMDYDTIKDVPWETNWEWLRVYDQASRTAVALAEHIRGLGYPARAHTLRGEQLAMIPHAYAAGLGELGKHGSLINRRLGSMFRLAVVTTDLPMTPDAPRDEGIDDFCSKCQMCTQFCPGEAIAPEKQEVRGVMKWVVETEKCAPYWASYEACGICLQVCPWNAGALGGVWKRMYMDAVRREKPADLVAKLQSGVQQAWSLMERPSAQG